MSAAAEIALSRIEKGRIWLYDQMRGHLEKLERVDEVKELGDRAAALEEYARRAMDYDAERKFHNYRLQCERRAGHLLAEMRTSGEREGRGGDRKSKSRPATLKLDDLGVTKTQSERWQKLAAIPEPKFREALEDRDRWPTVESLTVSGKENSAATAQANEVFLAEGKDAIAAWGWVREFERRGLALLDPGETFSRLQAAHKQQVSAVLPGIIAWLRKFKEES